MNESSERNVFDVFLALMRFVCIVFVGYTLITAIPGMFDYMKELKDNVTLIKNQNQQIIEMLSKDKK